MATGNHRHHDYLRAADDDHEDDHKDDDDDDGGDGDDRPLRPAAHPQSSSSPPRRPRAAASSSALFALAAILLAAVAALFFFFFSSSSPTIGRAFRGGSGTSSSSSSSSTDDSSVRHGAVRVPGASLPPSCSSNTTRPRLRFRRNENGTTTTSSSSSASAVTATFKILHLTDLHLGEGESEGWGPRDDGRTLDLIRFLLEAEWPVDLVILGGDQLTANNIDGNATDYHGMLLDVLANFTHPVDESEAGGGVEEGGRAGGVGVGWATMFGNHDDAAFVHRNGTERLRARTTRRQLWDFDRSYQLSYTGQCGVVEKREGRGAGGGDVDGGVVFGVSNYFLPLYHHGHGDGAEDEDEEVARLYVFDSGGGSLEQAIDHTQLDWFRAVNRGFGGGDGGEGDGGGEGGGGDPPPPPPPPPPALAFQHIPAGQFEYRGGGDECPGMRRDVVTPLRSDAGIVGTLNGGGNVRVLAVGHDHGSDYCCTYLTEGAPSTTPTPGAIHLCFNRHSGYGGYDSTTYPGFGGNWTRGGRVYQLELTPEPRPRAEGDGGDGGGGVDKEGGARPDPNSRYRFSWRSWARLADGSRVSEVRGT